MGFRDVFLKKERSLSRVRVYHSAAKSDTGTDYPRRGQRPTGVSVRALQYCDTIGLLSPSVRTEAGYRLYDEESLKRLQQILLFRALEFSLEEIAAILKSPASIASGRLNSRSNC